MTGIMYVTIKCCVLGFVLLALNAEAANGTAPLGNLLFTPVERAAIIAQRHQADAADAAEADPAAAVEQVPVHLDGLLLRPEGHVAWIDGLPYADGAQHRLGRVQVGRDAVQVGAIRLRPGQSSVPGGAQLLTVAVQVVKTKDKGS